MSTIRLILAGLAADVLTRVGLVAFNAEQLAARDRAMLGSATRDLEDLADELAAAREAIDVERGRPRCRHGDGEMVYVRCVGVWIREECGCRAERHFTWRAGDPEHARGLLKADAEIGEASAR